MPVRGELAPKIEQARSRAARTGTLTTAESSGPRRGQLEAGRPLLEQLTLVRCLAPAHLDHKLRPRQLDLAPRPLASAPSRLARSLRSSPSFPSLCLDLILQIASPVSPRAPLKPSESPRVKLTRPFAPFDVRRRLEVRAPPPLDAVSSRLSSCERLDTAPSPFPSSSRPSLSLAARPVVVGGARVGARSPSAGKARAASFLATRTSRTLLSMQLRD